MTVKISHTGDLQTFFEQAAGFGNDEGSPRLKRGAEGRFAELKFDFQLRQAQGREAEQRSGRPQALQQG